MQMSDLVERLRDHFEGVSDKAKSSTFYLVIEAADRIEQLEAALREIDEAVLAEREACAAIAAKRPHHSGIEIAELIRDQTSPPKAST
jgi:hypothetical protein